MEAPVVPHGLCVGSIIGLCSNQRSNERALPKGSTHNLRETDTKLLDFSRVIAALKLCYGVILTI